MNNFRLFQEAYLSEAEEYIVPASSIRKDKMNISDTQNRAFIMFRDKKSPSAEWAQKGSYYWNSYADGWFRSIEGKSKGYGLIFKNLKLMSKNRLNWEGKKAYTIPNNWGIYKATFEYVPNEFTNDADWETNYEKESIWFVVPYDVDPQEAIKLVMKDQNKWRP